ncbi:MAG TPA: NBR1-Ig-like domain-containing protein [Burkholderiales bacterium]|nr:NBR1-Ig-like domain-containing protein [Burkholderiales bacterium]
MQLNRRQRIWSFVSAGVILLACAPLLAPVSPTLDPNQVNTVIAGTAGAAATLTSLLTPPTWTPSFTPFPSATASITPSPTETFVFALATLTRTRTPSPIPQPTNLSGGSTGGKFACSVTGTSPSNGTVFSPNENFDAVWTVKNTGSNRWDASGMDYIFAGGEAMHLQNGYDLPASVKSGGSVDLGVDMRAPSSPGTYSTTWQLKDGKTQFCNMKLTIVVQ